MVTLAGIESFRISINMDFSCFRGLFTLSLLTCFLSNAINYFLVSLIVIRGSRSNLDQF